MKKGLKKIIMIAAAMVVAGALLFGGALIAVGGEVEELVPSTVSGEEIERELVYELAEVRSIAISTSSADVVFARAADDKITVQYKEIVNKEYFDIDFSNGVLNLTWKIDSWFTFSKPSPIKVYIPEAFVGDIVFDSSSGDVKFTDINANALSLSSTSGNISIKGMTIARGIVDLTSGRANIDDITADALNVNATSGDIEIRSGSVGAIKIDNTSGEVEIGAVTSEEIVIDTRSGDIDFVRTDAKTIKLSSTSGEIEALLAGREDDYAIDVRTTSGDCNITNIRGGERSFAADTTSGDVEISFTQR